MFQSTNCEQIVAQLITRLLVHCHSSSLRSRSVFRWSFSWQSVPEKNFIMQSICCKVDRACRRYSIVPSNGTITFMYFFSIGIPVIFHAVDDRTLDTCQLYQCCMLNCYKQCRGTVLGEFVAGQFVADNSSQTIRRMDNSSQDNSSRTVRRKYSSSHGQFVATMLINYMKLIVANSSVIGHVDFVISEAPVETPSLLIFTITKFTMNELCN